MTPYRWKRERRITRFRDVWRYITENANGEVTDADTHCDAMTTKKSNGTSLMQRCVCMHCNALTRKTLKATKLFQTRVWNTRRLNQYRRNPKRWLEWCRHAGDSHVLWRYNEENATVDLTETHLKNTHCDGILRKTRNAWNTCILALNAKCDLIDADTRVKHALWRHT